LRASFLLFSVPNQHLRHDLLLFLLPTVWDLIPAYTYRREIKELFDPEYLLNPGLPFDTDPIFTQMDFTPIFCNVEFAMR
jgi:hypothetical protein